MHTTAAISSEINFVRCQQQNPAKKTEPWFGRDVHAAKNVSQIRWQGIAAGIIFALGVILLPYVSALAGAAVIGLGVCVGVKTLYDASQENQLQKALIEVIGNKQKFDQLPEFNLTAQNRNEMRDHPKRFVTNGVPRSVMRVTRDNQTHGVLFKYQVEKANHVERSVQIFLFREPFNTLSSSFKADDNGRFVSYSVDIRTSMKGREGRSLMEMIHHGDFSRQAPLDK